jgi:hypothetical protein
VLLFAVFCLLLYRIAPIFLLQNHDGQNLYYLASGIFRWRESWLETVVFSPLHGMGSTFWPINPSFIPFLWPFALTEDPGARIYLLMVFAALTIFAASLWFSWTLRLRPEVAVAAAWLTFAVFMLQTAGFMTGTDPLASIVLTYVCLGILAETGRHGRLANAAWFSSYLLAFTILVLCHPGWHVIGLPLLGAMAVALIAGASGRAEALLKTGAFAGGFALHYFAGSYESLRYLFADTARVQLPGAFEAYAHVPYLAGLLFGGSVTEILWSVLLIIGLAAGLAEVSGRPRSAQAVYRMSVAVYAGAALVALWFLHSERTWPGPKPTYMLWYAYPLAALFAVQGIRAVARADRGALFAAARTPRGVAAALAIGSLLAWHAFNSSPGWAMLAGAAIAITASWLMMRAGLVRLSNAFLSIALLAALWYQADLIASGRGKSHDALERMAMRPNPITEYLGDHAGLAPGARFRGYADDAYAPPPVPKGFEDDLITRLITDWAGNWELNGNGMKLFNWSMAGIPTLSAYSPYISPLYFYLFANLLNRPSERQSVNYLTITQPDLRLLQLLGLRYLVSNQDLASPKEAREVSRWKEFRVYELPQPNLASYTPTALIAVPDAAAAVARLREPGFDPLRQALVTETVPAGLVPAPPAKLTFVRGGFDVEASSPGRSLVILPVQFTHCLAVRAISGDGFVRLIRVNLVQTGVLFERSTSLEVRRREWPLASAECQRQDYADSVRLLQTAEK